MHFDDDFVRLNQDWNAHGSPGEESSENVYIFNCCQGCVYKGGCYCDIDKCRIVEEEKQESEDE